MKRVTTAVVTLAMLGLVAGAGSPAEEGTVRATAVWMGQGRIIPTGQGTLLFFVGTFSGTVFVDGGKGVLNMAKILCPGVLEMDINGGKQQGQGRCVISAGRDSEIYAQWSCAGIHQVECKGPFVLTGGTGRFAGITGQGDFRMRTSVAELAIGAAGEGGQGTAAGLAEWPALEYRIP